MLHLIPLVFCIGCFHNWSKTDTALELSFVTANSVDWYQTNKITNNCFESNSLIGQCGENVSPNVYFPTTFILHALIAGALPEKYRHVFQGITIGAEANQVWMNHNIGYGDPVLGTNSSVLTTWKNTGTLHN